MFPYFIELHDGLDPLSINMHQIEWFADETVTTTTAEIKVLESYEEIKALMKDAGCLIAKADPRLDISKPLSMDDLCKLEMVGEPVWNSNTRKWMLVIDSALGDVKGWVDLVDTAGKVVRYEPIDVQKYPLYRMKA